MLGSRLNLIATVIGFGLSATFIVFICTRLIWGRLRRLQSRQRFGIVTRINLEQQAEHWITDIESAKDDAGVPVAQFNRELLSSMKETRCVICLAEYQDKESLRIMPNCGHIFHLCCIDTWLKKQSTCPICRLSIHDYRRTKHKNPSSASMPFNSSEISIEPSLPTNAPTESYPASQMHEDSISATGF